MHRKHLGFANPNIQGDIKAMDIRSKERQLIYLGCVIFSELDEIDQQLLETLKRSPYHAKLQNIVELKQRWIDLALEPSGLS